MPDHGGVGDTASRRFMRDTGGQGGATGGGDAVSGHIQRLLASEGSTVGGSTTNLGGLRGKTDMRGDIRRDIHGGGKRRQRKRLRPHCNIHHRRYDKGIGTEAGQRKAGIESVGGRRTVGPG